MLKKTTYYIKSPFSSARKRKLVKTTQFNQVTLKCHGTAVFDKNSALTSGKVYRKSSLSTMLPLGMVKFYRHKKRQKILRASQKIRESGKKRKLFTYLEITRQNGPASLRFFHENCLKHCLTSSQFASKMATEDSSQCFVTKSPDGRSCVTTDKGFPCCPGYSKNGRHFNGEQ